MPKIPNTILEGTYNKWIYLHRVRSKGYAGTPFTRRNKLVKNRIRASLEHLGSAQDPVKKNEKSSYHPFEELAVSSSENTEDATLTAAETSRTIIEVLSCINFANQ